jgi:diguanylate cyclase (GGDEF)-like protein
MPDYVRPETDLSRSDLGHSNVMRSNAEAESLPSRELSWQLLLALTVFYFVADTILNKVALGDGWQIFWPLNGVTISLLIVRDRRAWPLVLMCVAIGTGVGEFLEGNTLGSTLAQRILSLFEVVLSASLLPPFTNLDDWLVKPGLYRRFISAVLAGPAASGILASLYFHFAAGQDYLDAFRGWALADAMGIAATLPLCLALRSPESRELFGRQQRLGALAALAVALLTIAAIFSISRYPLLFILYPLLMLVDWLLGFSGSIVVLCCACVLAVFLTEHGYGPFASSSTLAMSRDFAVQLYLGFHLLGFLPISILFLERRRIHRELHQALAQMATLASVDSLTGVANRRTLDNHLAEKWGQAQRRQSMLALLLIDIDHFKQYNDEFGHQAGDVCLRAIATALSIQVRRPGDVIARFGGEEFLVLLPDTELEGAGILAEVICAAIHDLAIPHTANPTGRVTVSIGCAAMTPAVEQRFEQLIERADQMLYRAKRGGRNRVRTQETTTSAHRLRQVAAH